MLSQRHDPIVAVATAPGRAAVGIVRVSGRDLRPLVLALFGQMLEPRVANYRPFADARGAPIDHGLALYFPAPHSFTGEDVLELQAHGGPVVLQLVLARCLELASLSPDPEGPPVLPGLRLAQPGEFALRAFLNDKIDLVQAEAIADLIDASTEAAARSASRALDGEFSADIAGLQNALTQLRMLVEATLDFPEEEIDFLQKADASGQLARLHQALDGLLQKTRQGVLLRDGMRVVIAGQPNAGKSSLLNALAGVELAIVTPVPGTTRDRVQGTVQIDGVPVHIVDTAGLRDSQDAVEQIGIARTWEAVAQADALVFLHDLSRASQPHYQAQDEEIAQGLARVLQSGVRVIHVWNKADLSTDSAPCEGLRVSAKSGAGLQDLRAALLQAAGWQALEGTVTIARTRHVECLRQVAVHVQTAAVLLAQNAQQLELLAEELRLAQAQLSAITGAMTPDDLLGVIFSKFCIGK